MQNYLPLLIFSHYSFLSSTQLRNIHRNLGHSSAEKQMWIIEQAELGNLPEDARSQVQRIIKYCKSCQFKNVRPRRFGFSIIDPFIGDFNHVLHVDIAVLCRGPVLHIIDVGTSFQNGGFISKFDPESIWKNLGKLWIDVYAGTPMSYTRGLEPTSAHQNSKKVQMSWELR